MAEAFLEILLENLNSFARSELAIFCGINGEIKRLTKSLKLIQAVVEDAEQKEITSKPTRIWLQELKDAAHVLDDMLDEYSIRSPPHNFESASQPHCFSSLSSIKPNNIWFRYRIGKRLKEISQRLDQISEDRNRHHFVQHEVVVIREGPIQVPEWRHTGFVIQSKKVYGRDGDKRKIVELLIRHDHDGLFVYPIAGLGGPGKTTLAQLVFNDPEVINHFNSFRIWICISDDFSVIRILQSIMESLTSQKCDTSNLATLQKDVQGKLRNVRYLLVLDDVWNQDQDRWYQLRSVLECGSKGASVLVTTRDSNIASFMRTCDSTHELSNLSDDDCWSLLKERAFPNDNVVSIELEAIGKEIVNKCGGFPLAAQALGSLLHSKSDKKQWLQVKESEIWNLKDTNILPALGLSYFSLTPTSRRCFAFCAIFPKDEVMNKEELIYLWMANGFISSREKMEIEDVGDEIWNELYHKSFFQEVTTDDDGCMRFKMHDLVHDLAQSVTEKECFIMKDGDITNLPRSTHHIGYVGHDLTFNKKDLKNVESLRTFFNMNSYYKLDFGKFQTHCSLRALSTKSPTLPLLCYLIHLRYLALRYLNEGRIPTSICSLRKLKILKLESCHNLCHLPEGLANLQYLRHLIILRCPAISCMPPSIGKLSGLRTLSLFIVRSKEGYSLKELHGLNLCQRELSIKGLECVGNVDEAKGVNLIGIRELQVLSLSWGNSGESEIKAVGVDAEQVIEALQPFSNLKKFEVCGYKGSHFPSWMKDASCLNNLVSLSLKDCSNCVQLSALGKLPSLENLYIVNMACVEYMDDDECYDGVEVKAFISLKTLSLYNMPKLERLLKRELAGEMFPRLHKFYISKCPQLTLSCLPSVEELNILYCEEELIKSISSLCGLKSLRISRCSKLKELPTQLKSLHALEKLVLFSCDELECIPEQVLEALNSLRTLYISDCRALKCLPESIQHLTSLEFLSINCCPILEERCKEGSGEDWDKIQHIPNIKMVR